MTFTRLALLACRGSGGWRRNRSTHRRPAPRVVGGSERPRAVSARASGLTTTARVLVVGHASRTTRTRSSSPGCRAPGMSRRRISRSRGRSGREPSAGSESGELARRDPHRRGARRAADRRRAAVLHARVRFRQRAQRDDVLKRWNRDSIVGDIVAVIRSFRPQVIVAMLPDSAIAGDGQHQALELFVAQAFLASTNTGRFPVDPFGIPWLVSRIYRPGHGFTIETAGYDRASGKTFAELAMESRAQQRSQGLRDLTQPKPTQIELRRLALKDGRQHGCRPVAVQRTRYELLASRARCAGGRRRARFSRSPPTPIRRSVRSTCSIRRPPSHFSRRSFGLASTVRSALPWCRHPSPIAAPPVLPQGDCEPRVLDSTRRSIS